MNDLYGSIRVCINHMKTIGYESGMVLLDFYLWEAKLNHRQWYEAKMYILQSLRGWFDDTVDHQGCDSLASEIFGEKVMMLQIVSTILVVEPSVENTIPDRIGSETFKCYEYTANCETFFYQSTKLLSEISYEFLGHLIVERHRGNIFRNIDYIENCTDRVVSELKYSFIFEMMISNLLYGTNYDIKKPSKEDLQLAKEQYSNFTDSLEYWFRLSKIFHAKGNKVDYVVNGPNHRILFRVPIHDGIFIQFGEGLITGDKEANNIDNELGRDKAYLKLMNMTLYSMRTYYVDIDAQPMFRLCNRMITIDDVLSALVHNCVDHICKSGFTIENNYLNVSRSLDLEFNHQLPKFGEIKTTTIDCIPRIGLVTHIKDMLL